VSENHDQAHKAPIFKATNLLIEYRDAVYLGEALGSVMGQWLEATAGAGGKQHRRPYRIAVSRVVHNVGCQPVPLINCSPQCTQNRCLSLSAEAPTTIALG